MANLGPEATIRPWPCRTPQPVLTSVWCSQGPVKGSGAEQKGLHGVMQKKVGRGAVMEGSGRHESGVGVKAGPNRASGEKLKLLSSVSSLIHWCDVFIPTLIHSVRDSHGLGHTAG